MDTKKLRQKILEVIRYWKVFNDLPTMQRQFRQGTGDNASRQRNRKVKSSDKDIKSKKMNKLKSLVLITFVFCCTLTAWGKKNIKVNTLSETDTITCSDSDKDYFLLLKDKGTISLNTYKNDKIKEQKTFAISEKSIFATDQKERVAILDTAQNSIILYEIQTAKEIKLSIPYDIKPKCILLNNENLFVGGEMRKELLVQYHIQSEKWYQLEIPKEVSFLGKAVDDIVINDSLLIAIDNIIVPKYILFYHLNSTEKLIFSHFKNLKFNGTYENISKGRITPEYLGLFSKTYSGYTGASEHITIYEDLDLTSSFAISTTAQWNGEVQTFNDFLLIGDKLFIAHKEKGLGVFEIKKSYFKISRDRFDNFNVRVKENKVNYKKYDNKNVFRLTQIPNTTKIVLTIESSGEDIRHEIIEI